MPLTCAPRMRRAGGIRRAIRAGAEARTRPTPRKGRVGNTTPVCKLSKYRGVFIPATRRSPHENHCTNACPGCLVCVVGALDRFPHCKGANGSSENGAFEAPILIHNKLSTFAEAVSYLPRAHTKLDHTHPTAHGYPQASHQAHNCCRYAFYATPKH